MMQLLDMEYEMLRVSFRELHSQQTKLMHISHISKLKKYIYIVKNMFVLYVEKHNISVNILFVLAFGEHYKTSLARNVNPV